MTKPRKTIDKACKECGATFHADLREHNRGNAHFCSQKCSAVYNGKTRKIRNDTRFPNTVCVTCAKTFYRAPSRINKAKTGFQFCSRACKEQAQKLDSRISVKEIYPPHYMLGESTYRERALRAFGAICGRCGYARFTQLLQVHHKDRDRSNGSLNNLEVVCIRCHHEEHFIAGDGPYKTRNRNGEVVSIGKTSALQAEDAGS